MEYVIIGNSTAAIGAVEGIRELDKKSAITLISKEKHHTYSRPLISYLLYGKTDEEHMKYRKDNFYKDNNVTAILGRAVVGIDKDKKSVILDDGKSIDYDKLLIATGSSPFIPPMEGMDKVEEKFTFMSLDDAKALEKVLSKEKNVLVIGAGLIGLKCVEGICDKVKSITVVDLADRILPSILDKCGSEIVQKHIEQRGVSFILSDSVSEFSKNCATLKSGKKIDFDILIAAVGVRANTSLLRDIGGDVKRGIVTDLSCKTSIADIYAAGDCAESFDITINENRVLALLPNAYRQGNCAGKNMAGANELYNDAIPMNSIGFFGLHMVTAGSYDGEAILIDDKSSYKKLFVKDNLLCGYIIIGNVERAGIYTALIRNKTPLDTIDFELIKQKPQLMAFSRREREKKLGGVN